MSFKTRIKKKSPIDNRVTLQAKHNQKCDYFNKKKDNLIPIKGELDKLQLELTKYRKKNIDLTAEELESKLDILDKIKILENDISQIEKSTEQTNYFLDTGKILFNYSQPNLQDKPKKLNDYKKGKGSNTKSVMDYFNSKASLVKEKEPEVEHSINQNKKSEEYHSKAKMYESYLFKTQENTEKLNQENDVNIEICPLCNVERVLYMSEGKMICPNCGDEIFILIDSDKPSYKEPPREVSYFAYKRINHFNEWLAQFQAKESTDIPQDVYDQILLELKKERITDMKLLLPGKLREILKKLKKNKYYEHVPHIINRLNGEPPPTINRETEEELRRMFKEIQIPFHKFCPKTRKNFLSYSYVLHKFVELLELDEFIPCFMLLKSREKLHQQDQIWKQICEYLKWQFIPSV
tara:strand:+ start:1015 stop:2238 length:1224 start_codon:yes stop_codon:yes gene_type:complete